MTDHRVFNRHREKTTAAIRKAIDTLAPLCRHDSVDPAPVPCRSMICAKFA
jgi:hypothetical protein